MHILVSLLATVSAHAGGSVTGTVTLERSSTGPVIVYVENIPGTVANKNSESEMNQHNVEFKPGTLVVTTGSVVHFPNLDKVYHNVFSLSSGNEFDLGLYRGGTSQSVKLMTPGEVDLYCNIHPNMHASILVLQNTFFTEAKDGKFSIEGLPVGRHTVVAWDKLHAPVKQTLTVEEGGAVTVDFKLLGRPEDAVHTNKDGEMYGRYH